METILVLYNGYGIILASLSYVSNTNESETVGRVVLRRFAVVKSAN